jgi:hypothetical protein
MGRSLAPGRHPKPFTMGALTVPLSASVRGERVPLKTLSARQREREDPAKREGAGDRLSRRGRRERLGPRICETCRDSGSELI